MVDDGDRALAGELEPEAPRPAPSPGRDLPTVMPEPRGPLSEWLREVLVEGTGEVTSPPTFVDDPLVGDDFHLALYLLYELHYRGIEGVDERWEWHPDLLRVRGEFERRFASALSEAVGPLPAVDDVTGFLQQLTGNGDGPSVSAYLQERPALWRSQEEAIHRSAWQLKEADPHSWAIPRLAGAPKAALIEIQADEYGGGVERDIHAELYALTMERLGLSSRYNYYLDVLPGVTLSTVNLVSMFGLHRRWLGALVGHLAVFEMTSTTTMARYASALRTLGFDPWTCLFYDTHVVADAHHQTVAAFDLAGGLVAQDVDRTEDVVFGALAIEAVEAKVGERLLHAWEQEKTSLLKPVDLPDPAPGQLIDPLPGDDPRLA